MRYFGSAHKSHYGALTAGGALAPIVVFGGIAAIFYLMGQSPTYGGSGGYMDRSDRWRK
jgi:hypothetical protein